MKKIALIALAAATTLAAGAPAMAQSYGHRPDAARWDYRHDWDRGFNINAQQQRLDTRIDIGIRNGRLTRNEAASLRAQFRNIARLEANYRRNGLSRNERVDLERRLVAFETRLDREVRDGQHGYAYRR